MQALGSSPYATPAPPAAPARSVAVLAAALGFLTFMPVGLAYLGLLGLLLALLLNKTHRQLRWQQLRPWLWLAGLPLLWALLVLATQGWHEDSATRLFHLVRVALLLCLGLALLPRERWLALYGFMAGAVFAAAVMLLNQVWPLPDWAIWRAMLTVTGNSSSQKFIMLAVAAAAALWLALQAGLQWRARLPWLLAAALFASVVAALSVSRNSHLVLLFLPCVVLALRYRGWRVRAVGLLLLLAGAAAVWQLSPTLQPRFEAAAQEMQHFAATGELGGSASVRWRMYQRAWQGMSEQPLLGTGLGSWLPLWRAEMADENPAMAEINNPHNDLLLTGMEKGVPALLLLLALLLALGWHSARHSRGDALAGVAHLLVWTVFITALVNAPLRDANLGLSMLWLLAAFAAGQRSSEAKRD